MSKKSNINDWEKIALDELKGIKTENAVKSQLSEAKIKIDQLTKLIENKKLEEILKTYIADNFENTTIQQFILIPLSAKNVDDLISKLKNDAKVL